jgi:DNA-directed RNA polymerase specialized sigma24 family protein
MLHFLADGEENLPSTLLEKSELKRLLAESISQIPEIERTILALYYQEEFTLREIAQVATGCMNREISNHRPSSGYSRGWLGDGL